MSYLCGMRKKWRKITAWNLLALYALAFALTCGYGYSRYSQENSFQKPATENYQSIITGNQPGAAVQATKPIDAGFNIAHTQNKKTFSDFLEILKSFELSLAGSFKHYESFSNNINVRLRKADIIFPFHYFW
jgi:hypothetical protein